MDNVRFTLVVSILAITFVLGSLVGTSYTLKHQTIKTTDNGYQVILDGRSYEIREG